MCLSTIKRRRRLNADEIVFKAVNIHYDGLITTAVEGAELHIGWNRDEAQLYLWSLGGLKTRTCYSSGYHCYTRRKDCKNWLHNAIAICRIPAGTYVTVGIEKPWGHDTEVIVTPTLIVDAIQRNEDAE
jgi:hypothetical protein